MRHLKIGIYNFLTPSYCGQSDERKKSSPHTQSHNHQKHETRLWEEKKRERSNLLSMSVVGGINNIAKVKNNKTLYEMKMSGGKEKRNFLIRK